MYTLNNTWVERCARSCYYVGGIPRHLAHFSHAFTCTSYLALIVVNIMRIFKLSPVGANEKLGESGFVIYMYKSVI